MDTPDTERLRSVFPDEVLILKEFRVSFCHGQEGKIAEIGRFLHDEPDLSFDYLVDCAVWIIWQRTCVEVVYHLFSIKAEACPASQGGGPEMM